jgi:hypothetical protein
MTIKFESRIMIPAVIVLLSSCIGLIIVKVIDTRLKDISINMPTVNLPPIHISMPGAFGDSGDSQPSVRIESIGAAKHQPQKAGAPKPLDENVNTQGLIKADIKITNVQGLSKECHDRTRFVASRYESATDAIKYTGVTPAPSADHQSRPAPWTREQKALDKLQDPTSNGSVNTYYIDPKLMTPDQVQKFKLKAKFEKMTVQDYTNWLMLFVNNPEQLTAFHRANLRIIARGGTLARADLPRVTPVPAKSNQEYTEKISRGTLDNIPQPEYLGYLPYNIDQTATDAPVENRNLRHLDFINPDEPLKTWELTRVSTKISGAK